MSVKAVTVTETSLCSPPVETTTVYHKAFSSGNGVVTVYDDLCVPKTQAVNGVYCYACTPAVVTYVPRPPLVKDSHTYVWGFYEEVSVSVSIGIDVTVEVPIIITETVAPTSIPTTGVLPTTTESLPTTTGGPTTTTGAPGGSGSCSTAPPYQSGIVNAKFYVGEWTAQDIADLAYRQVISAEVDSTVASDYITFDAYNAGVTEMMAYFLMVDINQLSVTSNEKDATAYLYIGDIAMSCSNISDVGTEGYSASQELTAGNNFSTVFDYNAYNGWYPVRLLIQRTADTSNSATKRDYDDLFELKVNKDQSAQPLVVRAGVATIASSSSVVSTTSTSSVSTTSTSSISTTSTSSVPSTLSSVTSSSSAIVTFASVLSCPSTIVTSYGASLYEYSSWYTANEIQAGTYRTENTNKSEAVTLTCEGDTCAVTYSFSTGMILANNYILEELVAYLIPANSFPTLQAQSSAQYRVSGHIQNASFTQELEVGDGSNYVIGVEMEMTVAMNGAGGGCVDIYDIQSNAAANPDNFYTQTFSGTDEGDLSRQTSLASGFYYPMRVVVLSNVPGVDEDLTSYIANLHNVNPTDVFIEEISVSLSLDFNFH
ncbi:hypothetical protein CANCADRAFT_98928 [Tortispora caseinolytica NRRL Y-17796]|uniref:Uncharacterized protein n=1 Tax=Tortispora caseinolytica NRRL Y-17796 TaxID=767744 RepID=A0A1E4TE79_9ASCO|nr:hypothetical protein CANCADRAFT_98928 [Tortispora caseinolytica NRRL Y-17796]